MVKYRWLTVVAGIAALALGWLIDGISSGTLPIPPSDAGYVAFLLPFLVWLSKEVIAVENGQDVPRLKSTVDVPAPVAQAVSEVAKLVIQAEQPETTTAAPTGNTTQNTAGG